MRTRPDILENIHTKFRLFYYLEEELFQINYIQRCEYLECKAVFVLESPFSRLKKREQFNNLNSKIRKILSCL